MGKFFILIAFFLVSNTGYSQNKYPKDYFTNPLDIPLILSGSFGELRSNHFHSGLDIKTKGREGLNVLSSAKGYISRIKIGLQGYGKALYIKHPNGYTTVYGHLKKFSPKIEQYVKKQQYKKESFTIQLYPNAKQLVVAKGEIIAYSGNTGGSGGPHLHFEIRDQNSRPTNPMLFGIEIPDSKNPEIRTSLAYPIGNSSHINQSNKKKALKITWLKNGTLSTEKIIAYGKIGFGVNAIDKQNGALNNNGIFSLEMSVNDKKVYEHKVANFSFSESRYINSLIDYERYKNKRQRIQKCFVEPANKLSIYSGLVNSGYLDIKDGMSYTVKITAKDVKGNSKTLVIPILGKKDSILVRKKIKKTPYPVKAKEFNKISESNITVAFPKNSFYKDFYFDFNYKDSIVQLHNASVPLHKKFTLTFDISSYPKEKIKQLCIVRKNKKGKIKYVSTKRKKDKLYTLSKELGKYTLAYDTVKPRIRALNFKNKQWLTKYRYLKLKISDNLSNIKEYRGEIDGKWILLEYDQKKDLLKYDFNDSALVGTKHTLKVIAKDNANNTNVYIATFYKKD